MSVVLLSYSSKVKYLCIPVCYRNLECSRGMRGEYSEKSGHFFRNLIIVLLVAAMMCFAVSKGLFKTIIDKFNGRRNNTQITAVLQTEEESKRQSELQSVNAVVENNIHARHLYERLEFTQLGTIPGGFRMKDGHYENICPYYHEL